MDRISNLPDYLVELILENLPIIDRVKTSLLSKSWKLKWTFLPSLILDLEFFKTVPRFKTFSFEFSDTNNAMRYGVAFADTVNSLVLQHNGGLKEFSLVIPQIDQSGYSLFSSSIDFVMRSSSLQRLNLAGFDYRGICALPTSILSCVSLRSLEITRFQFSPPSWFQGFPNLTRFMLDSATVTSDTISHFVSVCPRLEEIILASDYHVDQDVHLEAPMLTRLEVCEKFIHVSVSNAQNLVSVAMSLWSVSGVDVSKSVDMFKLFKNSAQLEQIILRWSFSKFLGSCSVIGTLPRFGKMKRLKFIGLDLHDVHALKCLLSFCVSSPNMEELNIWPIEPESESMVAGAYGDLLVSMAEKYINGDLRHLVRATMHDIRGTKVEMKIIELLLLFSPILDEMLIVFHKSITESVKLECLQHVINFNRSSTKARFNFHSPMKYFLGY